MTLFHEGWAAVHVVASDPVNVAIENDAPAR